MCGIVGAIGKFNINNFKNSLDAIKHRGPDYESYFIYDYLNKKENSLKDDNHYIALGHRRLSIFYFKSTYAL